MQALKRIGISSPPRLDYRRNLRRFQGRILAVRIPFIILKTLGITCWAAVPVIMAVRLDYCGRNAVLLLLPIMMSALLFFFWKYYPGFNESAAVFDRYANRKSLAVNALEIILRNAPETPFTAYAVKLAAESLGEWRGKIPFPSGIRKRDLIPAAVAAAVLICPFPHGTTGTRMKTEEEVQDIPKPASRRVVPQIEGKRKDADSGRNTGAAMERHKPGSARQGSLAIGRLQIPDKTGQRGGSAGSGGDAGGKDSSKEKQRRKNGSGDEIGNQFSKQENQQTGSGINGNGGMSGDDESGTGADTSAGNGGGSSSHSAGERRKKEVNRKKAETRGGFQPLPPDNAPQAGRKLADGDEQGNDPGSGRGGETGAKKSRGTAAMLPVIPQPDTVPGRLGSGEDITSISLSPSGCGQTGKSLGNPGYPETAVRHCAVPARLRRKIRRELEKTIISKEEK